MSKQVLDAVFRTTDSLRAATPARVAVIPSGNLDHSNLEELGLGRQRPANQPAT